MWRGGRGGEWMENWAMRVRFYKENRLIVVVISEDYVLFDCPGQVELFTHHSSLRNIFFRIQKLGYRVCSHPSILH